ncbi:NAD(P)/FAD-dependent oxidoreductase [Membranihabitans maritimus]|uniref:NAD(P)/FAD-dependent oxidoreductase n=1 Tax=Membranihabitans maritimus TaxID=2904244 RepID=UPI001F2F2570|nr:NAD(P)/FAD-dependent oxidoreductase [Membranihabitans maritimus]
MEENMHFEVIIIGGSYAGLSAAMALGRSLRNTLVIDGGNPCNRQTPHSHNFITQDGQVPAEISRIARDQVSKYETVKVFEGLVTHAAKTRDGFEVHTSPGTTFTAKKLILATGLRDIMPDIKGFAECWGISAIHCPYCHGYEVWGEKTGILANGDAAMHYANLVSRLTPDLTLFTNGPSTLSPEQMEKLKSHNIRIIEKELIEIKHHNGQLTDIILVDQSKIPLKALYHSPAFEQHSGIAVELGCEVTEQGLIKVDDFHKTNVPGVLACGDNSGMRSVSIAVASGTKAGAMVNLELAEEEF